MSRDIQKEITDKIIKELEKGVNPWVCPWDRSSDSALPYNFKTSNSYSGMNIFILWLRAKEAGYSRNSWLTYNQAKELGGQVRKGEKSTMGIFYKNVETKDSKTKAVEEKEFYPMAKAFYVFNVEQIDGLELEQLFEPKEFNPIENAENLLIDSGVMINHGGTRAFYRPLADFIQLPDKERFSCSEDYYATALHELVHSTGNKQKLDRDMSNEFGSPEYAFEELIAEMGSAFLGAELGLVGNVQHTSYIESWLKALKGDKKFIFKAATQASKVFEFILNQSQENKEVA